MNYFVQNKLLCIPSFFCMAGVVFYVILVFASSGEDQLLLLAEPYSNGLPYSLNLFNFETTVRWHDLPKEMVRDVFTASPLFNVQVEDVEDECVINPSDQIVPEIPFPIILNGWSGSNENLIFIFSALNSNETFIGTVGDSFENPSFTIISFDLRSVQTHGNLHTVPVVTILDKELNRLVNLVPALYENSLNAIE